MYDVSWYCAYCQNCEHCDRFFKLVGNSFPTIEEAKEYAESTTKQCGKSTVCHRYYKITRLFYCSDEG